MLILAFDRDLLEHRKGNLILQGAELLDLFVASRLLAQKIVRGESQHFEAPVFESVVERLQSFVLWGETALAGDVDQ